MSKKPKGCTCEYYKPNEPHEYTCELNINQHTKPTSKFTEGEWEAKPARLNRRDPMFYKADVICGGTRIAHVAGIGEDASNANARLIAAAPDLYTACIYALNELKHPHPNPENKQITIDYLQQAITEAEGNQ